MWLILKAQRMGFAWFYSSFAAGLYWFFYGFAVFPIIPLCSKPHFLPHFLYLVRCKAGSSRGTRVPGAWTRSTKGTRGTLQKNIEVGWFKYWTTLCYFWHNAILFNVLQLLPTPYQRFTMIYIFTLILHICRQHVILVVRCREEVQMETTTQAEESPEQTLGAEVVGREVAKIFLKSRMGTCSKWTFTKF